MSAFSDMNETMLYQLTDFFKILGDPTRVKLILLLAKGEYCVTELAEQIGATHSAVSHQVRLMRAKNLLKKRKSGKQVYYAISNEHIGALIGAGQKCLNSKK